MPPHREYCEPFVGGGAVFLHKRPAALSVLIDRDGAAVERLAGIVNSDGWRSGGAADVHLVEGDGISYLQNRRWSRQALVYVDPPYPVELRRRQRPIYRCELSSADHDRLVDVVLRVPCMVMVSGYDGPPYSSRLGGWRLIRYRTCTHAGVVQECLWCNFPEPVELHDTRYLGSDYRRREVVRRRTSRWVARFARLPAAERQAVLEALAAVSGGADVG